MHPYILVPYTLSLILLVSTAHAEQKSLESLFGDSTGCLLMYDLKKDEKVIEYNNTQCKEQLAPASTFNIALSLMGYNEGILKDQNHPQWDYQDGYPDWSPAWKKSHTPLSWKKDSVLWYSQVLTSKLGLDKINNYLIDFNYGNQDMSGNEGKNDGISTAWLNTSLKISAYQQLEFIMNLINEKFTLSKHAYEMTKKIVFIEQLSSGWNLYGKTGVVPFYKQDGTLNNDIPQIGWFVGWIEKNGSEYAFALNMKDNKIFTKFISLRTKDIMKEVANNLDDYIVSNGLDEKNAKTYGFELSEPTENSFLGTEINYIFDPRSEFSLVGINSSLAE